MTQKPGREYEGRVCIQAYCALAGGELRFAPAAEVELSAPRGLVLRARPEHSPSEFDECASVRGDRVRVCWVSDEQTGDLRRGGVPGDHPEHREHHALGVERALDEAGGQTALALAAEGVDLALAHGTHIEDAEQVAAQAREIGRRVILLPGDLSDPSVPADLVSQTIEQLGALDVLVANAGIGQKLSWDEVDLDTWQQTLAVNLTAPWLLTRAALPGMLDRGFGGSCMSRRSPRSTVASSARTTPLAKPASTASCTTSPPAPPTMA